MEEILNYIKINELISTSGQPSVEQFKEIAQNDFEVVINLALHDASNAIENEDKIVTDLEMAYFHIPVDFDNPKPSDVKLFLNTLQALGANKVWVHCALNYRVSAFMYIYHKYVLQTAFDDINISLFQEWLPDTKWQEIIKISLEEIKKA
ncbi:protein tyrosine phosphatase family protein [Poseidonibacter antarcticus]|uniref:protein tyrosine phosphatase family protein n=1 Tax=Poseidonibacter antarcticus TaxID=2478538 RepID=UPI000EF524D8|nr:protein tyrosine phosphatase family protein [Poseidonibacter antarcticus]